MHTLARSCHPTSRVRHKGSAYKVDLGILNRIVTSGAVHPCWLEQRGNMGAARGVPQRLPVIRAEEACANVAVRYDGTPQRRAASRGYGPTPRSCSIPTAASDDWRGDDGRGRLSNRQDGGPGASRLEVPVRATVCPPTATDGGHTLRPAVMGLDDPPRIAPGLGWCWKQGHHDGRCRSAIDP
jgi:hypothetical protein